MASDGGVERDHEDQAERAGAWAEARWVSTGVRENGDGVLLRGGILVSQRLQFF